MQEHGSIFFPGALLKAKSKNRETPISYSLLTLDFCIQLLSIDIFLVSLQIKSFNHITMNLPIDL